MDSKSIKKYFIKIYNIIKHIPNYEQYLFNSFIKKISLKYDLHSKINVQYMLYFIDLFISKTCVHILEPFNIYQKYYSFYLDDLFYYYRNNLYFKNCLKEYLLIYFNTKPIVRLFYIHNIIDQDLYYNNIYSKSNFDYFMSYNRLVWIFLVIKHTY